MVDLVWHPFILPGLLAWILTWLGAVAIYAASPRREANRLLALVLFFEGVNFAAYNTLRVVLATDPLHAVGMRALEWVQQLPVAFLYLAFLGTVDAPLSRPFSSPKVRKGLVGAAGVSILAWPLLSPVLQAPAMLPTTAPVLAPGETLWFLGDTPISDLYNGILMLVLFYGLAVAWSAYRNTDPGTAARSRALAYLRAFGLRDAVVGSTFIFFTTSHAIDWPLWVGLYANLAPPLVGIAFVLLLGYGVLKTQLFDIDLKIKRGLSRSTVAGTFGALFLVVSEGVELLIGVEGTIYGVGAAVLVGLVFRRVEAAAQDLADVLMPGVEDTEEYREQRKLEVYRAAVEDAAGDADVTEKERDVLAGLRENLGLDGETADRLEREVLGASGGEAA